MKQKLLLVFVILSAAKNLSAQNVGIGTTTPHASAALEIKDTTKGVLIPRMTTAQRDAIVNPAVGLMILNLDDKCADIYNGTTWIKNCGFTITQDTLPGIWTQKANFGGTVRYWGVGFSIGSKGYLGTGYDGAFKKDFWEYDPVTNSWTQKADFGGTARYEAVGFSIETKGYIGTGDDGTTKNDFWEYDPAGNSWTQKADFGGTARRWAAGFSIGSKGYIGTGDDGAYRKDFWEYDPAGNSWTQKTDFGGIERIQSAGFSIGTKGYLGTGFDGSTGKKDFWEYDPVGNSWTQKTDFGGTASWSRVGFSIGTKGYLGTGYDGAFKKDFWEYNAGTNTWTQKTDFASLARYGAVGFSIGSKGYIGTGIIAFGPVITNDFWEYNPYPVVSSYSNINNSPNYYFVNGGLWVKTGDTLKNSNSVSWLSLNNAGISSNVGIGTKTPSQKLHVVGNAAISGNTGIGTATPAYPLSFPNTLGDKISLWGAGLNHFGFGIQTSLLQIHGSAVIDDIVFGYGSSSSFTERMRIKGTGDVGIGTITPSQKLDVAGNTNIAGKIYVSDSALLNGNAKVAGNAIVNGNAGIGTTTPSQKLDVVGNANVTGKIFVSDSALLNGNAKIAGNAIVNGNVGIGTTAPSQKLDVLGNTNITGKIFVSDSALFNGNAKVAGNAIVNGNTGIGTSTPSQKLDVAGNANVTGKIYVNDSALLNSNTRVTGKIIVSDSALLNGNAKVAGNAIVNGNMGIGTAAPTAKLHVVGNTNLIGDVVTANLQTLNQSIFTNSTVEFGAFIAGKEANAGKIGYQVFTADALDIVGAGTLGTNRKIKFFAEGGATFTAAVNATAFNVVSDARYKTNISSLNNPVQQLMQLRGVSYYFNRELFAGRGFPAEKQYGFLAQEVEKTFPQLVSNGSDGYKSVNYLGIIPLLTESIKAQQQQIEMLTKQNEMLIKEMKEIKKIINR